jgi:hypothetical protein
VTCHWPLSSGPLFHKQQTNWEAIGGVYDSGVSIRIPLGRHKGLPKGIVGLEGKTHVVRTDRLSAYSMPAACFHGAKLKTHCSEQRLLHLLEFLQPNLSGSLHGCPFYHLKIQYPPHFQLRINWAKNTLNRLNSTSSVSPPPSTLGTPT